MKLASANKNKIVIWSVGLCMVMLLLVFAYLQKSMTRNAYNSSMEMVDTYGREYKNIIEKQLTEVLESNRTLVSVFEGHHNFEQYIWEPIYDDILQNFMETYPDYLSVCLYWELKALDSSYNKLNGRTRNIACRIMNELFTVKQIADTTNDVIMNPYYESRDLNEETIWDPYYDVVTPGLEGMLMSTIAVPIKNDGIFEGLVGIDISLDQLSAFTDMINPYENTVSYIVASNNVVVGHSEKDYIGKDFISTLHGDSTVFKTGLKKTRNNEGCKFSYVNENRQEYFVSFKPIKIGNVEKTWTLGIEVPAKEVNKASNHILLKGLAIGLAALFMVGLVLFIYPLTEKVKET